MMTLNQFSIINLLFYNILVITPYNWIFMYEKYVAAFM